MGKENAHQMPFGELQNLLQAIHSGILYLERTPPFRLRYATDDLVGMCGYSQEELLQLSQMDLVHPDDIDQLAAGLQQGEPFSAEFRLLHKNGSWLYVLCQASTVAHEDGDLYLHCLLTDIHHIKITEQALALSQAKYTLAVEKSDHVIVEYNPANDALYFSENYTKIFHQPPPACATLGQLLTSNWALRQAIPQLGQLFSKAITSKAPAALLFEISAPHATALWVSLTLSPLCDPSGHIHALVGCLENIDEETRHLERLTKLSQRDPLTNAFNRTTIEQLVRQGLKNAAPGDMAALLALDIDQFKSVNEKHGLAFGDQVLVDLVRLVEGLLPPQGYLGRLGGDEFLIFVPNVTTGFLEQFTNALVFQVSAHFSTGNAPITISLGAAYAPAQDTDFKMLYKNADAALYEVKKQGRNGSFIRGPQSE